MTTRDDVPSVDEVARAVQRAFAGDLSSLSTMGRALEPLADSRARDLACWIACVLSFVRGDPWPATRIASIASAEIAARVDRLDLLRRVLAFESFELGADPHPLWSERAASWSAIRAGNLECARAEQLREAAAAAKEPMLTVEAAVLEALVGGALPLARRASRMARSEGAIHLEYLSNIVLARVRRLHGQAHLAARILAGLRDHVPPVWRRWLEWEEAFAGGNDQLRSVFVAARNGDVAAELDGLRKRARSFAPALSDVDALGAALLGTSSEPIRLAHLELMLGSGAQAPVYVLVEGGEARRILRSGIAARAANVAQVESSSRKDARVQALLATLALRGALPEPDAFREVYGFAFVPSKHQGVFRVLVHRARAAIEGMAELRRSEGMLELSTDALLIPDPESVPTLLDRAMLVLGERAEALSAKQVAEALGVSVRAAHGALRELAERGELEEKQVGRGRSYRLEDTTFFEPTRSRVSLQSASRTD